MLDSARLVGEVAKFVGPWSYPAMWRELIVGREAGEMRWCAEQLVNSSD